MMHTRTVATPLLRQELYEDGLRVIEAGIEGIREFLDEYDQSHRAEECAELDEPGTVARGDFQQGRERGGRPAQERDPDSSPTA